MRITITCEDCGRRHRLEREFESAGPIWIMCHACETPLRASLEESEVRAPTPTAPLAGFADAWGGILDLTHTGLGSA